MKIVDLDVVVPEPLSVKFGGEMYELPGDMPMEIFLRVNLASNATGEDGEPDQIAQMNQMIDVLTDLFTWQRPEEDRAPVKATVESVLKKRGIRYCFQLLNNIYKDDDEDEEAPLEVIEGQVHTDEDSSLTKNSSTLPSQATTPTPIAPAGS